MAAKQPAPILPLQQKGGPPQALRRSVYNVIANALTNLIVQCPQTDGAGVQNAKMADVKLGDTGLVITMPPQYNTTSGPQSGSGGGGNVQQFKIVSDGGDWWVCNTWDGTTQGMVDWYVIKPYKLRAGANGIGSETIRGVTYTYTYTSGSSYYTRSVSGSDGSSETDYMTPDSLTNDIIYAMLCTTTILASNAPPANPSGGQLLDINVDARAWSK